MMLTAPQEAIDQLGHVLSCIIHTFAESDPEATIFMAKFDIKDGFWRLACTAGDKWNFTYVMPQPPGQPVELVVPNSLQTGWVESLAYFCTTSETAQDVATWYTDQPLAEELQHKFLHYSMDRPDIATLP